MDAYQSEIFEFLTTRDNFDSFVKLTSHYEKVKEELLRNFWRLVDREVRSRTGDTDWLVSFDANIFAGNSKLQMYKKNWLAGARPMLSIVWEGLSANPYRGLLLYMDTKGFDMQAAGAQAVEIAPNGFKTYSSQWWAWWANGALDFTTPKGVSGILPDKLVETTKEWAEELYGLAITHEAQLDGIVSSTRAVPSAGIATGNKI